MSTSGIIFSNLNDTTLSRLTPDRTVAAIPFGCRYRLVDFALSTRVKSDILDISIVANYNYRSLVEHIGHPIYLVECGAQNIKITTKDDVIIAESILRSKSSKPNSSISKRDKAF